MGTIQRLAYASLLKIPPLRDRIHRVAIKRAKSMVNLFIDKIAEGERVLDLGCGFGDVSKILIDEKGCDCTLVDVNNFLLNKELEVILYDGERLMFEDEEFDTVLLIEVLHHCSNPEQVLSEAARVSCGKIIIIEGVFDSWWERSRTMIVDSLINLEFLGHPHQNKQIPEWIRLFKKLRLEVTYQKEFTMKFLKVFTFHGVVFILKNNSPKSRGKSPGQPTIISPEIGRY